MARRLGLPPAELERVRDGAILHDVGKVAIPNEILYKPGPLTDEEWAVMREHPLIGERILRRTPELQAIAPLVRTSTSAGTVGATPTAWPARRSPPAAGSSSPATPTAQ